MLFRARLHRVVDRVDGVGQPRRRAGDDDDLARAETWKTDY